MGEFYIMLKKRNNPMLSSMPKSAADTGTKRKQSRSTYGQNILQRGDAYQTTFDEKEEAPILRQQEIRSSQHSDRAVIKNTILFPASNLSYPDHVSSADATSLHTHSLSSEEQFEQIVVSSKLKRSNSKNKKALDSQSIIGKTSFGAQWKKVKASTLKYLNRLDKNHLEKIASIVDIEVDWINTDGADTNSVMIERVKEWITKDMDRYFSESIDDAVDGKVRKLKIEKLQNIIKEIKSSKDTKEIKSSKDKNSEKIGSDQTVGYNPSQQIQMQSSIASSDMISVEASMLFVTPPSLATTVKQMYTSSETKSVRGDTLQFSKKAKTYVRGKIKKNEQQKLVCELCFVENDNTSNETEVQNANSTRGLPWNLKENCSKVKPPGTKCLAQNNYKFCAFSGCLKMAKKGGKCISHGGGIRCSVAECSNSAKKGGKCISHGGGTRWSVAECSKTAKKGGKCKSHGGGTRCSAAGCSKFALKEGKCASHGGGTHCSGLECSKIARGKGGTCVSHGGGTRCSVAECSKSAKKGGKCASHGGGTRCSVAECSKYAQKEGKCRSHFFKQLITLG